MDSGKRDAITNWGWDWSFCWGSAWISRHCEIHPIPVTNIKIKVGMHLCKCLKRLVSVVGWTSFVHIKNWSDWRLLCKVGLRQVGEAILRTAFRVRVTQIGTLRAWCTMGLIPLWDGPIPDPASVTSGTSTRQDKSEVDQNQSDQMDNIAHTAPRPVWEKKKKSRKKNPARHVSMWQQQHNQRQQIMSKS